MISEVDLKDFDEYQNEAWGTALVTARNASYLFNGLSGEVGEVCSLYAKVVRDGVSDHQRYLDQLKKELGDVLWFVAGLSKLYGFTLKEVAEANIEKLKSRQQRNTLKGSGNDR
jgi:NTP pyrophosphatase (non-canonical NTP hydrolase)